MDFNGIALRHKFRLACSLVNICKSSLICLSVKLQTLQHMKYTNIKQFPVKKNNELLSEDNKTCSCIWECDFKPRFLQPDSTSQVKGDSS